MRSRFSSFMMRTLTAVCALSVLAIAGCGEVPEDPTVTRSKSQAEQLRDRLRHGQGAT